MIRGVGPIHRGGGCVTPREPIITTIPGGEIPRNGIFTHIYFVCCDGVYRNSLRQECVDRSPVLLESNTAEREFLAVKSRLHFAMRMHGPGRPPLSSYYFGQFPLFIPHQADRVLLYSCHMATLRGTTSHVPLTHPLNRSIHVCLLFLGTYRDE